MAKIFLIAGCPRSGTSLVAGLLAKHGVWIGDCIPSDQHNQMGYYENRKIVELTKKFLKTNRIRARSDSKPVSQSELSFKPNLRRQINKALENESGWKDCSAWLYKDSKMLLTPTYWMDQFPDATWILPLRDKEQIKRSLMNHEVWIGRVQRSGLGHQHFDKMISNLRKSQEVLRANKQTILVKSDLLITDKGEAKKFIEKCGLTWDEKAYDEFVRPDLWHR